MNTKLVERLVKVLYQYRWNLRDGKHNDDEEEKECISNLLEAFRQVVPEESHSTCVCDRLGCWNDCREEILKQLEG